MLYQLLQMPFFVVFVFLTINNVIMIMILVNTNISIILPVIYAPSKNVAFFSEKPNNVTIKKILICKIVINVNLIAALDPFNLNNRYGNKGNR